MTERECDVEECFKFKRNPTYIYSVRLGISDKERVVLLSEHECGSSGISKRDGIAAEFFRGKQNIFVSFSILNLISQPYNADSIHTLMSRDSFV